MWHWRDGAVEGNGGEKARVRALAGASGVRGSRGRIEPEREPLRWMGVKQKENGEELGD